VARVDLARFSSCPIAARFIDTAWDARSYYAHKLVAPSDHAVDVRGTEVLIRFNAEEIHLFTETIKPGDPACGPADLVVRMGGKETRRFSIARARMLDLVLPTIENPARVVAAKGPGVLLLGPADPSARRLGIVLAPSRGDAAYYARTSFEVTPSEFNAHLRARPRPWPP
jgi:hypothetical protein